MLKKKYFFNFERTNIAKFGIIEKNLTRVNFRIKFQIKFE